MAKIIGNTTTTPMARPDWNQMDATKADYIKNKPTVLTEEEIVELIEENGGDVGVQSDWAQTDDTQLDYVKNKPELASGDGASAIRQKLVGVRRASTGELVNEDGNVAAGDVSIAMNYGSEAYQVGSAAFNNSIAGDAEAQAEVDAAILALREEHPDWTDEEIYANLSDDIKAKRFSFAHAEGEGGLAKARGSHVEGKNGKAYAKYSHVEGNGCWATESAESSHVGGESSVAAVKAGFAHGHGVENTSGGPNGQTAVGAYNDYNGKTNVMYMVGVGTSNTDRKNALEVMTDGSAKLSGNLTLGSGGMILPTAKEQQLGRPDPSNPTSQWNGNRWAIYATTGNFNGLIKAGHIMPQSTNSYELGSSDLRWGNIFVADTNFTNLKVSGFVGTNLLPKNDRSATQSWRSLGSKDNRWYGIHADTMKCYTAPIADEDVVRKVDLPEVRLYMHKIGFYIKDTSKSNVSCNAEFYIPSLSNVPISQEDFISYIEIDGSGTIPVWGWIGFPDGTSPKLGRVCLYESWLLLTVGETDSIEISRENAYISVSDTIVATPVSTI